MAVYNNVLDMVGNTPTMQLSRLNTGQSQLFLKLENQNPGGSIKDRTGLNMIVQAEKRGTIHPGQLIVEATAGNTGLGLALACRMKGYRLLLVIPDKMSAEKIYFSSYLAIFSAYIIFPRKFFCYIERSNLVLNLRMRML